MKMTLIPALALTVALLAAGPAFADNQYQNGKDSRAGASSSVRGGGGGAPIRYSPGYSPGHVGDNRGSANYTNGGTAHGNYRGGNSGGYGGGYGHGYSNGGGGSRYTYAFASHDGWSRGHTYFWHGHHYGWYNNGWFIIDVDPDYNPYYYYPDYGYSAYDPAPAPVADDSADDGGGSPTAQVQQALARMGYYHGAIDGIMGPNTSGAISAYQRDNNLRVTGTVNGRLLDALDLD